MGEIIFKTLRETVVDAIRTKILNHELPPGARIIEQEISAEFGVSRGPIREAFRQLEQEGLVEYTRNMGCSVKNVTLEDVFEVYMLRVTYEIIAIKSFMGTIPPSVLSEMAQALKLMENINGSDFTNLIAYDNMFHFAIIKATKLPRLIKVFSDLDYATILSCFVESQDSQTVSGWQHQVHKRIYDAYCTGDTDTICRAVANHYIKTVKRKIKEKGLSEGELKFSLSLMEALL